MIRRLPLRLRIVAIVVAAAAVVWLFVLPGHHSNSNRIEGSGSIEATQVDIAPKVAGRVTSLKVREGDTVAADQVVAELDHDELDAQVAQARAAVALAEARVAQADAALTTQRAQAAAAIDQARAAVDATKTRVPQAGESVELQRASVDAQIEQAGAQVKAAASQVAAAEAALQAAEANIQSAQAVLTRAQSDAVRADALFRDGAVSAQQVEGARTALAAAVAQRDAARAQRDGAKAQRDAAVSVQRQADAALAAARANRRSVPIRELDVAASRAQVDQAEAALRTARAANGLVVQRERDLEAARAAADQARAALTLAMTARNNAVLRSPMAGTIVARQVEVGALVTVGSPVMTVADLANPYLRIFVGETDLGRVKLGQKVEVRVDAYKGRVLEGTVSEISNRAEFTPGNVQTKEERVKLVFGVKVLLSNSGGILKPGLPADAAIQVEPVAAR